MAGNMASRSDLSRAFTSIWHGPSCSGITWDNVKGMKENICTLAFSWPCSRALKLHPKGSQSLGFVIWAEKPNGFSAARSKRPRNVDAMRKEEVKIQKTLRKSKLVAIFISRPLNGWNFPQSLLKLSYPLFQERSHLIILEAVEKILFDPTIWSFTIFPRK